MSLARDDFGYLSAIDALETNFLKTGTIEKRDYSEKVSGQDNKEPEISDVYEKKPASTPGEKEKKLEKIQREHNELEMKNKDLQKINTDLEKIGKIINNNEETENTESARKKEQALGKINELMSGVRDKQNQIARMQKEIQQTVSSLVELEIGGNSSPAETGETRKTEELKQSAIREIKENPETVKKLQVKNIDKNLLLAMLSLRD